MTVSQDSIDIDWLGYATARVAAAGTVVYTDPGRYGVLDGYDERDGDIVLVTHNHHYDPDGIERVAADDATVVLYEAIDPADIDRDVASVEDLAYETIRVDVDDHLTIDGVEITVTPAHNLPPGSGSHPPGFGCGFCFTLDNHRVFWPGDTDRLDQFDELDVSVLLANIGGTIVMDRTKAAELADRLEPDLVVPIHYNTIEILETDDEAFAADVASRSIPVALDRP